GDSAATLAAAPENHSTSKSSTGSAKPGSTDCTLAPKSVNTAAARATSLATSGSTLANPRSALNAIRIPATPSASTPVNGSVGGGTACQSRASGPLSTSSISAQSATLAVIGPTCASVP